MKLRLSDITHLYFCTGARNQELLKTFTTQKLHFEYDERMASFKALGLAKISQAPVAICTTSGTAVSECVSAMLEARYSNVPLVLITGDRPKKLHGTGSPQTIEHGLLTVSCRGTWLEVTLEEFQALEIENPIYPLHINVLVDDTNPQSEPLHYAQDLRDFQRFLSTKKAPLFLFSHEETTLRPLVEAFAKTGHLFYAETLSGGRELSSVPHEKAMLELYREKKIDAIVRVGHTPLTKLWRLLEKESLPTFSFDSRGLPALSFGTVLKKRGSELLDDDGFWSVINACERAPAPVGDKVLEAFLDKYPRSEMAVMKRLQLALGDGHIVYLGNSLVVRFFDLVQAQPFLVYGNRGVNGIDGQLASAIGLATGTTETVTCVLGDITALYDLSSLREMPKNLRLVIINNQGGRIFDMLKLDPRIILEHDHDFSELCRGFGLLYSQNLEDLAQVQVLELRPEREQTRLFLQEWNA